MLSERQRIILQILVDDYIRSAEPVGSRTISKRPDMSFSSATIRNEMSDLEELGYLEQPHTSAGRIPSQKGYRFYVDNLLQPQDDGAGPNVDSMRSFFLNKIDVKEQVVQQSAQILSSLTNYTSIVLGPQSNTAKLRHIQLLPLQDRMAVAIIVTDSGHVENRTVTIPDGVPLESMQQYMELLNRKLMGVSLRQLKTKLHTEIASELLRYSEQYEQVMALFDQMVAIKEEHEDKVYLGGTTMIMNQPEFRDLEKLRPLLDMFEQSQSLAKILGGVQEQGVLVRIGQENALETIHNCSLITASYSINGEMVGTVGVLGPTRMDYARVIRIMNQVSTTLSGMLTQRLHK